MTEVKFHYENEDNEFLGSLEEASERTAYWTQVLNLSEWHIRIKFEPVIAENPEAWAMCNTHDTNLQATITFTPDIPMERLDEVVIHELLHVMMRDYDRAAQDMLEPLGMAGDGYEKALERATETLVDRLVDTIYELHGPELVPSEADVPS